MRIIGQSISEAIDWTQDRLRTTRPVAERVLFSLLQEHRAQETEQGFVLMEDNDDEIEHHRQKIHHWNRPRFRFHPSRMSVEKRLAQIRNHLRVLGYSAQAEEMMRADAKAQAEDEE